MGLLVDAYASVGVETYPDCSYYLNGWGGESHGGKLVPIVTKKGTKWVCTHPNCPYQITESGKKIPKETE